MPTIFLDTNVFIDAGYFRAGGAQAFLRICKLAGFELAVPEVVLDEVRGNFKKDLDKILISLKKSERQANRLVNIQINDISIGEEVETFNNRLDELLDSIGVDILPYPETTTKDIVVAGYSSKKPFKENGEGHKDFLIWKSIVNAITPAHETHVFVTSNTSDFSKDKTKETFVLHGDLRSELPADVTLLGFTGRQSLLEKHILPSLDGWKPWSESKIDFDFETFADEIIGKELPHRTMYGLEGLPFNNDVSISMYGEPQDLVVEYALIEDQYMVRILGNSECLFDGFMDKFDYFSDYSETLSGSDWNDHVVHVETEALVNFEIIATYAPQTGKLSGATLEILNEIEDEYYT